MPNTWRETWRAAALVVLSVFAIGAVAAQDHDGHARFHMFYQNWRNKAGLGCCNDRDCHPVADQDLRVEDGELLIHVRGVGLAAGQAAWCPVRSHHYLATGNAPDWSTAHACISDFYGGTTPCAQLICFQPKPQF